MLNAVIRYTVIKKVKGKIECENIIHQLAKYDRANFLAYYVRNKLINYILCPRSPLQMSKGPSAIELIPFFQEKLAKNHHTVFTEMKNDDLEVILGLPQQHGKKYFDMLCVKD